jgi:hypothetical protein
MRLRIARPPASAVPNSSSPSAILTPVDMPVAGAIVIGGGETVAVGPAGGGTADPSLLPSVVPSPLDQLGGVVVSAGEPQLPVDGSYTVPAGHVPDASGGVDGGDGGGITIGGGATTVDGGAVGCGCGKKPGAGVGGGGAT